MLQVASFMFTLEHMAFLKEATINECIHSVTNKLSAEKLYFSQNPYNKNVSDFRHKTSDFT